MKQTVSLLSVFFLVLSICSSCKQEGEIQGSVFIVTKGAQNYKLALVEVTAIPENEMSKFIESKKVAINAEYSKYQTGSRAMKGDTETAQRAYDEAKSAYDGVFAKLNELKSKQQSINLEFNPNAVAEDEYARLYDTPEQAVYRVEQRKLQKQLESISRQVAQLEPKVEAARRQMASKQQELSSLQSKSRDLLYNVRETLTEEALFKGLPDSSIKATTDADGRFTMKLPRSGKYALAARGQRRVFDSTEEYYWLVWVNLDGQPSKQVMLSNQNLLGQDSSDSVFQSKDLLPTENVIF